MHGLYDDGTSPIYQSNSPNSRSAAEPIVDFHLYESKSFAALTGSSVEVLESLVSQLVDPPGTQVGQAKVGGKVKWVSSIPGKVQQTGCSTSLTVVLVLVHHLLPESQLREFVIK